MRPTTDRATIYAGQGRRALPILVNPGSGSVPRIVYDGLVRSGEYQTTCLKNFEQVGEGKPAGQARRLWSVI